MPDAPDWYPYLPGSERYIAVDAGELASRLGSPVTYDRRGEVLWYSMFQDYLDDWKVKVGTIDVDTAEINSEVLRGGVGAQLKGRGAANNTTLWKGFAPLYAEKMGFEVAMALLDPYNFFQLRIIRYDGTNVWIAGMRASDDDDELQYYSAADTWVKALTIPPAFNADAVYCHCKMVVDLDDGEYVRFLWNDLSVDLPGIAFYSTASVPGPYIWFEITFNADNSNDLVNLGHAIITANEPT